jgi:hypothetical protein
VQPLLLQNVALVHMLYRRNVTALHTRNGTLEVVTGIFL